MVRGGKIGGKRDFKKKVWSKESNSDDSDEDYVVSDEGREASDYYCSSLDGCASEESDNLIEEEEEFKVVRNFNRSKAKNGVFGRQKKASKNSQKRGMNVYADEEEEEEEEEGEEKREDSENVEEDDDEEYNVEKEEEEDDDDDEEENENVEEDEEEYNVEEDEETQGEWNFSRSKVKNGVCGKQANASKTSQKRRRITRAEQLEEEEEKSQGKRNFCRSNINNGACGKQENKSKTSQKKRRITNAKQLEEEEEEEEVKEEELESTRLEEEEDEEWEGDGDGDGEEEEEDFEYDDEDDEFTPEEEDCSDEEEEISGKMKKNNGTKMGKVFSKRAYAVSTRGQKRRSSRASKKPTRSKRSINGKSRRKVKGDDDDDFVDNGPVIMTRSRKKQGQKRRSLLLSDSDRVSSGSSDFEFTISEEEGEQVREAKELCGSLRDNLRSSSILINNEEEAGVHTDLHQQQKPVGRKGKEKIEEPQVRKGKVKAEDLKSEVGKQVCGICLTEEGKRRIRGVLNCCTHYFCFACIMEWAKVESRCPLCKKRFKTISKPARSAGVDLREAVIQVPERDQVYQPSEEELRSYIDPYESVICSECHEGGDDGLMLLCDICDSPAHTYCVGLGQEVPEGNWYCDGCRPVALGSSISQVQESDPGVATQSLPVRPSAVRHVRESIDLNSISSPRATFNQGAGHLSSSRFAGRIVEGTSPVYGGAPTLSERRWIHRHIQHMLTSTRTDGISTISSTSDLYRSQIDQSRETSTQHTRTQDVGTSYHTFFEEGLCNSISPIMQNGSLWPSPVGTPPVPGYEQVHQFSRSNIVADDSSSAPVREDKNSDNAMEQLLSMVKSHLKSLSQNIDLGQSTFKDIARSSMHTILAACGIEHDKNEVCMVPRPSVCPHIELMAGGQSSSLIKGCCSSCFDSFVGDVVKRILDTRISSQWLRLGL